MMRNTWRAPCRLPRGHAGLDKPCSTRSPRLGLILPMLWLISKMISLAIVLPRACLAPSHGDSRLFSVQIDTWQSFLATTLYNLALVQNSWKSRGERCNYSFTLSWDQILNASNKPSFPCIAMYASLENIAQKEHSAAAAAIQNRWREATERGINNHQSQRKSECFQSFLTCGAGCLVCYSLQAFHKGGEGGGLSRGN